MGEVKEVPSRHLTIPIWYGEDPQAQRAMTENGFCVVHAQSRPALASEASS